MFKYWKNSLLCFSAIALSLGLAEFFCRLFVQLPVYPETDFTTRSAHLSGFNELQSKQNPFEVDPDVGYRLRLNPALSRHGFQNGAEYDGTPDTAKNIAIIGDSLQGREFLKDAMKYFLKGKPFKVWNIGIPGYNTPQEWVYFQKRISLKPDILVLSFCLNDFEPTFVMTSNQGGFRTSRFEPLSEVNPFLFHHSILYRMAVVGWVARQHKEWHSISKQHYQVEAVSEALNNFKQYAASQNIKFVVLIYPLLVDDPKNDWGVRAHELVLQLLAEQKIDYLDLKNTYDVKTIKNLRETDRDHLHPNQEGHFIAGRALIEAFPQIFAFSPEQAKQLDQAAYADFQREYPVDRPPPPKTADTAVSIPMLGSK